MLYVYVYTYVYVYVYPFQPSKVLPEVLPYVRRTSVPNVVSCSPVARHTRAPMGRKSGELRGAISCAR
jgi:hypothetical protein